MSGVAMAIDLDSFLRMVAAVVCGGLIGLNRDTPQAKTALIIGWEF